MYRSRNVDEAWERICDHFRLNKPFSLRQAILVGFPGVTSNNVSLYGRKLVKLFREVETRTAEIDGVPHVRLVKGENESPAKQVWELPSISGE